MKTITIIFNNDSPEMAVAGVDHDVGALIERLAQKHYQITSMRYQMSYNAYRDICYWHTHVVPLLAED